MHELGPVTGQIRSGPRSGPRSESRRFQEYEESGTLDQFMPPEDVDLVKQDKGTR
jgi:hypothetical protein